MIKKIALVLLLVGICICCSACQSMTKVEKAVEPALFSRVESYAYGDVIVDNETGVMYWVSTGTHNCGTLTLLVDKNGNPKIFEGR